MFSSVWSDNRMDGIDEEFDLTTWKHDDPQKQVLTAANKQQFMYSSVEMEWIDELLGSKSESENNREKQVLTAPNEQPSMYSPAEIRLMKALDQACGSKSESDNENVDPDLDINLFVRIFESNPIIGESQSNVKTGDKEKGSDANANENSSVFEVSVNANFDDTDERKSRDDDFFKQLEFAKDGLLSKSPVRKRPAVPQPKNVEPEDWSDFDWIYETIFKDKDAELDKGQMESEKKEEEEEEEKSATKRVDRREELIEEPEPNESSSQAPEPVLKLKFTADGRLVVDTDTLVVEKTSLSGKRNAIANSEQINESGCTRTSYKKKGSTPKQRSPEGTGKFYVGTDSSSMAANQTKTCMKRKFWYQEKTNSTSEGGEEKSAKKPKYKRRSFYESAIGAFNRPEKKKIQ